MVDERTIQTGWLSLAGGMSGASRNWREAREDQASLLVNCTVRDGFARERPSMVLCGAGFTSRGDRDIFETGRPQGSAYFPLGGSGTWVYVVDGIVFAWNPLDSEIRAVHVEGVGKRALSRNAEFAWLQPRSGSLIIQDGVNKPLILDGRTGVLRQSRPEKRELRVGTDMADGWGRLAILSSDRRRVYFSDHEDDSTRDPLTFTEDDYYLNPWYFTIEGSLGRGVSLHYMPYLDSDSGLGPLVCHCEHGTLFFDVSAPRDQWSLRDIRRKGLPNIGCSAHGSVIPVGMDLAFPDQRGRLRTVQSARRDEQQMSFVPFDRSIRELTRNEDPWLIRHRRAVVFDERVLFTVSPTLVRTADGRSRVAHRGIAVLELDKAEPYFDSDYPVWAGLWTGPRFATLDTGLISPGESESGEEVCYGISVDGDGRNRIYEITRRHTGTDTLADAGKGGAAEVVAIRSAVASRWMDGGNSVGVALKSVEGARLTTSGVRGRLETTGYWQSDGSSALVKWFTDSRAFSACGTLSGCSFLPAAEGHFTVNLPVLARGDSTCDPATGRGHSPFRKGRAILVFDGQHRTEEFIIRMKPEIDQEAANTKCSAPPPGPGWTPKTICPINPYAL